MIEQTRNLASSARQAKLLQPQPGPWMIARPRLLELLDQATRFPLTIVTAPAGYGKTSLLSDWASRQQVPVAWYALDEADNSFEQFLLTFISAIRRRAPFVGGETLSLLRFATDIPSRKLA